MKWRHWFLLSNSYRRSEAFFLCAFSFDFALLREPKPSRYEFHAKAQRKSEDAKNAFKATRLTLSRKRINAILSFTGEHAIVNASAITETEEANLKRLSSKNILPSLSSCRWPCRACEGRGISFRFNTDSAKYVA
jgi:hypothetical protein